MQESKRKTAEEQDSSSAEEEENTKREKHVKNEKASFPYGNYLHYYGYRANSTTNSAQNALYLHDPRLAMLNEIDFTNKKCLDIGCNSGLLTIEIGSSFAQLFSKE